MSEKLFFKFHDGTKVEVGDVYFPGNMLDLHTMGFTFEFSVSTIDREKHEVIVDVLPHAVMNDSMTDDMMRIYKSMNPFQQKLVDHLMDDSFSNAQRRKIMKKFKKAKKKSVSKIPNWAAGGS